MLTARVIFVMGGLDWENMYRERWSFDKCVPWYLYSPHRIKYPYLRGELAELWRTARKNSSTRLKRGRA